MQIHRLLQSTPQVVAIHSRVVAIRSLFRKTTGNFKRPKNREDSSDFDDSWTESIAAPQSTISENFAAPLSQKLRENFEKLRENVVAGVGGRAEPLK